jgi:hypothetical protein
MRLRLADVGRTARKDFRTSFVKLRARLDRSGRFFLYYG